jgi:hypothetical protein
VNLARSSFVTAILVMLAAAPESARAAAEAPDPDSWRLSLSLYAWIPSLEGSLSGGEAGGTPVAADIDVDLSDAIENLDSLFGLMAHVEAGRGPLTASATCSTRHRCVQKSF